MRTCTVCIHPARSEIDRALISQSSYRSVAKRFGVSQPATFRHRQHMPATLVKAQEAQEIAQADSLVDELRGLAIKARTLTAQAEESGDIRTALMGLREIGRILELKARVAGEIAGAQVRINIAAFPIDQLSDDQADELHRKLAERRIDRLIPPQQRAEIAARMEDAIIDAILSDPEKRERLRTRLALIDRESSARNAGE